MCHHVALSAVTVLYAFVRRPTVGSIGLVRTGGSADTGGLCYHPVAGWVGTGTRLPRRTKHEKD